MMNESPSIQVRKNAVITSLL